MKSPRIRGGFSLVEIVMALGIVSFAIVGIMGLFPVAMKSALESQRETRAAQIAQQIFSDLRSGPPNSTYVATGTNILSGGDRTLVNLAVPGTYTVGYDGNCQPIGATLSSSTLFLATITVDPNKPFDGVATVLATIKAPPAANTPSVQPYMFSTVLGQR